MFRGEVWHCDGVGASCVRYVDDAGDRPRWPVNRNPVCCRRGKEIVSPHATVLVRSGFYSPNPSLYGVACTVGNSVERRLEEYWCKWTTNSLAATNWIPTNWPARNVHCFVLVNTSTAPHFFLPDWSPAEDCTLHLYVSQVSGGPGFFVQTANGTGISNNDTTAATYREFVFSWVQAAQTWCFKSIPLQLQPYTVSGSVRLSVPNSRLPEDSRFTPAHPTD